MRKFIRHPSDIPIEFSIEELAVNDREYLKDISFGGLSFRSKTAVGEGAVILIKIPFLKPEFQSRAIVKWCREHGDAYDVGVAFDDQEAAFKARMVEQICYIEHYKREVYEKEGRILTGEEAAIEWIKRYAASFPEVEATD